MKDKGFYVGLVGTMNFMGTYDAESNQIKDVHIAYIDPEKNSMMLIPPMHPVFLTLKEKDSQPLAIDIDCDRFSFLIDVETLSQGEGIINAYKDLRKNSQIIQPEKKSLIM